ncbi:hypothetical protein LINPERHAP2_LOCUS44551, partial [Linum perenne]
MIRSEETQREIMATVWDSLKKSFQNCKTEPAVAATEPRPKRSLCSSACSGSLSNLRDVIHGSKRHSEPRPKRSLCSSACSGSLSNLRDVIHGSKRHSDGDDESKPPPPSYSPRSLGSNDFMNPVAHDVVLSDSTSELKIVAGGFDRLVNGEKIVKNEKIEKNVKKSSRFRTAPDVESDGLSPPGLRKCSVQCKKVLKVNNSRATLSQFEEHRERVKTRATKLPTKHPRCLADGNELLRFHGTNATCPLTTTTNGSSSSSSSSCTMDDCGVCQILRNGFSKRELTENVGVYTASTSKKALEKSSSSEGGRKALVLCRVIAGRVHKPVENIEDMVTQTGFDSLAGKFGQHSSIEELYLLDPKALLPCFV